MPTPVDAATILSVFSENLSPEPWSEQHTQLRQFLFVQARSFKYQPIFDIPPSPAGENFVVSPKRNFAYENRILPAGWPIPHQGRQGWVVFDGDVSIPMLIDMKIERSTGDRFPVDTKDKERVTSGVMWMSLTPSEMITQRPGVEKARGTVVIGGLGLGWLLRKTCEKESVDKIVVVEKSQELLDWYGYDLCKRHGKVAEVICDDIYNQIGKHGRETIYLLDIWQLYFDARNDSRLRPWKRKLKTRLWAWGL